MSRELNLAGESRTEGVVEDAPNGDVANVDVELGPAHGEEGIAVSVSSSESKWSYCIV